MYVQGTPAPISEVIIQVPCRPIREYARRALALAVFYLASSPGLQINVNVGLLHNVLTKSSSLSISHIHTGEYRE